MKLSITKVVFASCIVVFTMGHGDGCCSDDGVLGPATETECPPSSTLTYASFGQQFMTDYCTKCHSLAKTGAARMGATPFHDFDTLFGVQAVADHIDQTAGAGPNATNTAMPPDEEEAQPTLEQRRMLAEWIACGAP